MSKRSISSLFENTSFPYELILIDNTENNRGLSIGRNLGASMATGKYIAFSDDDILFQPGWLEECVEMVEQGEKFMATPVWQPRVRKWELPSVNGWRQNYRVGSNCMVMRKTAFDDIGKFSWMRRSIKHDASKTGMYYANRITAKGYTFLVTKTRKALDMGIGKHSYL
jgi:glycosyltransferase involved in cell wall biosynthesis